MENDENNLNWLLAFFKGEVLAWTGLGVITLVIYLITLAF